MLEKAYTKWSAIIILSVMPEYSLPVVKEYTKQMDHSGKLYIKVTEHALSFETRNSVFNKHDYKSKFIKTTILMP